MSCSPVIAERVAKLDALSSDGRPRSAMEEACIRRQRNDLLTGHERGLHWNEDAAAKAVGFCGHLRHWQGRWAGTEFAPEMWQSECVLAPLFGWYRETESGLRRRYTVGYAEVPRKNGKSFISAAIGCHGLLADGEQGPEVYSAATTKDQASIVFRDAKGSIAGGEYGKYVRIMRNAIDCPHNAGTFQAVSADYNFLQGKRPSRVIVDELHAHKTRDVWDALITGMGSRDNPLLFGITTAGVDRSSICWEQHEYARQVLEGHIQDDTYFCFIASAEAEDDFNDPEVWRKANPNYGISIDPEFLRTEARKAVHSASYENTFRRLHLNQWTEQEVRWIPMHAWDACNGQMTVESLHGRECYAALDLASTRDVTALVLVFPLDDGIVILPFFWAPREAMNERADRDRRQVCNWMERGYIEATDGNVTDYDGRLPEAIMEALKPFDVVELGFDPWGPAQGVMQRLERLGFDQSKMVEFRQTIQNFAGPTKEFERLVCDGKVIHNHHPVLRWMVSNVAVHEDANGNIRPVKNRSADKIDGVVAVIMGIGMWKWREHQAAWYQPGSLAL